MSSFTFFLKRVWNVIRGRSNAFIGAIESPEDQLRLFVNELDSEIGQLRQAVTAAMAEENKLKMKIENLLLQSQDWEKKAMLAVNRGQVIRFKRVDDAVDFLKKAG